MKILLAYDGFEHSDNAVREAAELAGDGTEITILSVVPPDARGSKSGGHVGLAPHAHEDVARAHAYLRERGIEATMEISTATPSTRSAPLPRPEGMTSSSWAHAATGPWAG